MLVNLLIPLHTCLQTLSAFYVPRFVCSSFNLSLVICRQKLKEKKKKGKKEKKAKKESKKELEVIRSELSTPDNLLMDSDAVQADVSFPVSVFPFYMPRFLPG